MAKKHKGEHYFEVRTEGDGDFEWFSEPPEEGGEENYDPTNLQSAIKHAKEVGGYVVEVSVSVKWEK